jgi:hypothetical protein
MLVNLKINRRRKILMFLFPREIELRKTCGKVKAGATMGYGLTLLRN